MVENGADGEPAKPLDEVLTNPPPILRKRDCKRGLKYKLKVTKGAQIFKMNTGLRNPNPD